MTKRARPLTAALALAFLVVHAQYLPRSLEDIDSINFALGVEAFDVTAHRPHPPGYPVFIALGKVSTAVAETVVPAWDRNRRAAVGLAVWGVLAGALSAWILVGLATTLRLRPAAALFGAALTMMSPLFWFTASRPLSDVLALVASLAVQFGLLRSWDQRRSAGILPALAAPPSDSGAPTPSTRAAMPLALAFCAGLLIGVRSQTMWLTGPLLVWTVIRYARDRQFRVAGGLVAAAAFGALTWAVPLVLATGGLDAYLTVLAAQGAHDFRDVIMLATSFDMATFTRALAFTFIAPWREEWFGQLMLLLALIGAGSLLLQNRRALLILAAAFVPYLVFHLLFQETATVRYALPVVVPVALLAAVALSSTRIRAVSAFGVLVVAASLFVAHQSLRPYSADVPPTFLAFTEAARAAGASADPGVVIVHGGLRRVADWFRPEWPTLPALRPGEREWLRVVDHFRRGNTEPIWFMTDRRRTDAVLFDHRSRRVLREYRRQRDVHELIGEVRLEEVRWWEITSPGWMLGQGWALSAEVGGVTHADGREPHQAPARAFLRRGDEAHRLMIGGRYLSGPDAGVLVVALDDRELVRWPVSVAEPSFLHWLELPASALEGSGPYAELSVRVEAADAARQPPHLRLEQFDFSAADDVIAAFGDGWYEPEVNPALGTSWRWAGQHNTLRVYSGGRSVRLTIEGESSLRYFDRPSTMVVKAGGQEVRRFHAGADFLETIDVPAALLAGAPSMVTIELDQVFVPAEVENSADRRRLGLRLYRVDMRSLPGDVTGASAPPPSPTSRTGG